MKVALVLKKTKGGVEKHILNGKSISEMSNASPIERICVTMKTNDGITLKPCIFHSHTNPNSNTTYDYCVEDLNCDAFCTTDFTVYDTCFHREKLEQNKKFKIFHMMYEMLDKYSHHMEVTYRINDEFLLNYEKRKVLIQKKQELEKEYGQASLSFENNPEYITLSQLVQKAEDVYFKSRANLEKIYDLKPQDISKEEFIFRSTKDDLLKVEKTKANLEHWCNKQNKSNLSKEHNLILSLVRQISSLTNLLKNSFETPCVYIYKAIRAIDELYHYFKKNPKHSQEILQFEADKEQCEKYFSLYREFIGDISIETIIRKVEKEQQEARTEESKIKSRKFIQNVKNVSENALVVKLDGTTMKDTNDEKLIIGNMVQGRIEDEQWRSIRR
jgi:hypothetical protein